MNDENPYAASIGSEPDSVRIYGIRVSGVRMFLAWLCYLAGSVVCMMIAGFIIAFLALPFTPEFTRGNTSEDPPGFLFDWLGFGIFIALNFLAYWFSVRQVIVPSVTPRAKRFQKINLTPY